MEVAAVCTEHAANLKCEQFVVANKVEYKITKVGQTSAFELMYKNHKHCQCRYELLFLFFSKNIRFTLVPLVCGLSTPGYCSI